MKENNASLHRTMNGRLPFFSVPSNDAHSNRRERKKETTEVFRRTMNACVIILTGLFR
jgi:hypothetical protein